MTRYFTIHKSYISTQAIRCKAETAIQAAKLIAKKLFTHTNKSKISMSLRETTKDSKKRIYNYIGTNYNNQIKVVSHRKSKGGNEENIEDKTFILQHQNGRFIKHFDRNPGYDGKKYEYTNYEGGATLWVAQYSGEKTSLNKNIYKIHIYPYKKNKYNLLYYYYELFITSIRTKYFVCDYDRGYFYPLYRNYRDYDEIGDGINEEIIDYEKLKFILKDPI